MGGKVRKPPQRIGEQLPMKQGVREGEFVWIDQMRYRVLPQSDYKVGKRCERCTWLSYGKTGCLAKGSLYMPLAWCEGEPTMPEIAGPETGGC